MRYRKPKNYEQKILEMEKLSILTREKIYSLNDKNIFVEIGMGRGDFITEYSKRFPENIFIGIEKQSPLLISAGEKILREGISNIKLMSIDANKIIDYFEQSSVSGFYLNFSDPWSKQRYKKRRLTYIDMLKKYEYIAKVGAKICLKTDNLDFFNFSINQIEQSNFKNLNIIRDLYSDENLKFLGEDNEIYIKTEYEKNFISQNKKIYALECECVK